MFPVSVRAGKSRQLRRNPESLEQLRAVNLVKLPWAAEFFRILHFPDVVGGRPEQDGRIIRLKFGKCRLELGEEFAGNVVD